MADDRRTVKAEQAAERARLKAMRPWYRKKRFLLPLALVVLIAVLSVASGGADDTKDQVASDATETGSAATPATVTTQVAPSSEATATFPMQSGDWRLDSLRVKDDGLGDFGAVGRVTYTGDDETGGENIFTVTIFKAGADIAVLNGSANEVPPGRTVTVQFFSTDKYVAGPYEFAFQHDL